MNILRELALHLIDTGVVAQTDTTSSFRVFASMVPDSCHVQHRVVGLIETGGTVPDARVDLDRPGIQITVRGDPISSVSCAYEEASDKAHEIFRTIHAITPGVLSGATSGNKWVGVWAQQAPFFLEWDQQERPYIVTNFRVNRSRT